MKKQLTIEDQKALAIMASQNWGSWTMPNIGIEYTASQIEDGGQVATFIKFQNDVATADGYTGKKMRVYPTSKRNPSGKIAVLR